MTLWHRSSSYNIYIEGEGEDKVPFKYRKKSMCNQCIKDTLTDTWAESLCKIRNVKRAFFQINKTVTAFFTRKNWGKARPSRIKLERWNHVSQQLTRAINDHRRKKPQNETYNRVCCWHCLCSDTAITANYSDKIWCYLYTYTHQKNISFLAALHEFKQTTTKAQQHSSV